MNKMQTRQPAFAMGVLALIAFGCSDPSVSQPKRDAQVDFGTDQGLPPILDMAPDVRMLGSFGDPCSDGSECLSRFCIEALESGRICTKLCGECPLGYECNPVANDGPDRTFICTTDQHDLCKPCQTDRDCDDNADRCLTIGHNQYCGEDCSEDGVCPDGYKCADLNSEGEEGIHQCVPANNEGCQPCRDEDGDGYGDGADCLGFDCRDDNSLIYEGAPEICDGRDNNCNSEVDEPALLTPAPEGIVCLADGVCRGTRVECIAGEWVCNYPESYEEGVEISCDGLDNDCDATADDDLDLTSDPLNCAFCGNACDFPNAAGECFDSACELGDCGEGWFNVDGNDGNGCEYNCNLTQNGEEVCDEIDNDCDGSQDEGFDTQTDPSHCGACNRLCELPNATPSCIEGQCGIEDCNAGWVDRNAEHLDGCEFECDLSNEGVEICDGLDNDCDGGVDEDFDFEGLEHCGGCDQACGFDNGLAACDGGNCALVGCLDGWFDPNVTLEDGCEYACVLSRDGVEACDTIDNDCDSSIDEDFDLASSADHCGGCGRACFFANGVGICADSSCALDSCVDGFWNVDGVDINGCEYVCVQNNGGVEACDQADNDCDGALDEDFDVLSDSNHCGRCNNACILDNALSRCGLGNCLISECIGGFWDIDGETANGCEYACQPTNDGVEVCDEIDNDCDGTTDEDFDFNTDVEHCGGCGESCGANNGTVECQDAGCVFTGCAEGFYDLDGSPDNGCEYACEFVQAIDVPDAEALDANCDGIDGNAMGAVFVAGDGSPNGLGTQDDPLDSINAGIALAANGGISQVLVSTGNYDETVDVVNGISLYGSYSRNDGWARDLDAFESRINGEPIGLRIDGINRSTYVQGFTVTSANGTQSGESSVAMHATNVQADSLVISHCRLLAGDGADGEAGNNGQRGDSGQAGNPGGAGCDGCSGGGVGGGGGASTCNQGGSGGRGGHNGSNSGAGANGGGGNGGRGGTAVGTGCEIGGRGGASGRVGGSGVHGRGGNGGGRVTDGAWIGDRGRDGRVGSDGGGGGGASGGGGTTSCIRCGNAPCDLLVGCVCNADRGGGGGGGGGAGCGGHGGLGGSAGGGSFAAFLISADVTFEVSELQSGRGGNGGAGGAGANGGVGANGADGGTGQDDSGPGARGGQGGNGGRGGDGGGGSGGVSYALYTLMANPVIDVDTLLVAGPGGEGGPGQRAGTAGNAAQQN